jgi:MraZ protein
MDEKGRVSLPSAFRGGGSDERFILVQWEKPYLTLFPEAKWNEIEDRLDGHRQRGRDEMNYVRRLYDKLAEVSPDKQGRILVPAALQGLGGLKGTVLLLGMRDRVELWDPATYDQVVPETEGDVTQGAHRLFG